MTMRFDISALVLAAALSVPVPARAQSYNAPTPNYLVQQPAQQVRYVAPQVNSVYAQPMRRMDSIPLYGKNKSAYFYGQQPQDEGMFAGGGLYVFGLISTGATQGGVNMERPQHLVPYIGSDSNTDMGEATGYSIGFGRVLSSTLAVEFSYTDFSGMSYGYSSKVLSQRESYVDEDTGETVYEPFVYEGFDIIEGGGIDSKFVSVGFQYKLGNMFGTLLGGMIKPYVGLHVGYSMNTLGTYSFTDKGGYTDGDSMEVDDDEDGVPDLTFNGYCSAADDICEQINYIDGTITYEGKTTRTFGYALEAGLTMALDANLELDFFYKRNVLGKVQNSGNMFSTYYEQVIDWYDNDDGTGFANVCEAGYSAGVTSAGYPICEIVYPEVVIDTLTPRVVESGKVNINQFGVKLRYLF